jgi:hypothetical protein
MAVISSESVILARISRIRDVRSATTLSQYEASCTVQVLDANGNETYPATAMSATSTEWSHEIPASAFPRGTGPWRLIYRAYALPSNTLIRTVTVLVEDDNA